MIFRRCLLSAILACIAGHSLDGLALELDHLTSEFIDSVVDSYSN
jgi:hypothetical protein